MNYGLTSNKPIHYLLNYDDFNLLYVNFFYCTEFFGFFDLLMNFIELTITNHLRRFYLMKISDYSSRENTFQRNNSLFLKKKIRFENLIHYHTISIYTVLWMLSRVASFRVYLNGVQIHMQNMPQWALIAERASPFRKGAPRLLQF